MSTTAAQIQSVMDLYFQAWVTQNSSLLHKIFTEDAIYKVKPFGLEEYKGLEAIIGYWKAKTIALQTEPKPKIISKAIGTDICFIEWETTFTTTAETTKTVRGILVLLFRDGLVSELREHYSSKEE